jgi:hypothetical protein
MLSFLEAQVVLLPAEIGGRTLAVAPRDGNYRPRLRVRNGSAGFGICFIEGPPRLSPGSGARVVVEFEATAELLVAGEELEIVEGTSVVGLLTVLRVF